MSGVGVQTSTFMEQVAPSPGDEWRPASSARVPRPAPGRPWAPSVPRASGAVRRPAELPHFADVPRTDDGLPLPYDLAVRFRALCAQRQADPARVLETLVRGWVILGLAGGAR